ncbi:MAG: response regulator transcription factor [Acidobacteriota bacterium]|nr:response regulator transcription factor [Acidobacteriota bacterium]
MTKVLIADDHALVRHGIRRIVESEATFSVVAEAGSGMEAVEEAGRWQPEIAILDVGMRGLSGLAAIEKIREVSPCTRTVFVSMHADKRYVQRAVLGGASGYVLKDSVEEELLRSMFTVREGGTYFSPAIQGFTELRSSPAGEDEDPYGSLTARERQIYQLLAEGLSNKEIANLFDISLHTVETHRARIMEKLGLHTAAELVISAVRRGLVA